MGLLPSRNQHRTQPGLPSEAPVCPEKLPTGSSGPINLLSPSGSSFLLKLPLLPTLGSSLPLAPAIPSHSFQPSHFCKSSILSMKCLPLAEKEFSKTCESISSLWGECHFPFPAQPWRSPAVSLRVGPQHCRAVSSFGCSPSL